MKLTATGIELGSVTVGFFGVIVALGLAAGGFAADRAARRRGEDAGIVYALVIRAALLGLAFARLLYVLNPPPSVSALYGRAWYLAHPFDLQIGPLAIWSGGLDMAGALIGAALGIGWTLWRSRVNWALWADILTPGVLAALVILPWANVVNRDMLGPPTNLPWGIAVESDETHFNGGTQDSQEARVHPTPAYLALWTAGVLGAVLVIQRRTAGGGDAVSLRRERKRGSDGKVQKNAPAYQLRDGDLFMIAAMLYLPALFAADFLRVDVNRPLAGLTVMQALALALIAIAGAILARRLMTNRRAS